VDAFEPRVKAAEQELLINTLAELTSPAGVSNH
jgi:hypothetical protein